MNTGKNIGTFARYADPNVKTAARSFGYALTNPDWTSVCQLTAVLYARLRSGERKFLAVATLLALSDDEYQAVINFMEGES